MWSVRHKQTSPSVLTLFHPFLWQTLQDERPVLATLYPPTGLGCHHITTTTEHSAFRFFRCWYETCFTENVTRNGDQIIYFCGVLLIWKEIKVKYEAIKSILGQTVIENVSSKRLLKSLVCCCVFAAAHKKVHRKFTNVNQGDLKAHNHWNSQDFYSYPVPSSIYAHQTLAKQHTNPVINDLILLYPPLETEKFDFFLGEGNELSPGKAQEPEPHQDKKGNWSHNTETDKWDTPY